MQYIENYFDETVETIKNIDRKEISKAIDMLFEAWKTGKCVFVMGNGGSASTATHFTSDLLKTTNVEGKKRFKAIGLTDNMPVLSAWTNDGGWDCVYQEQLENFLAKGDVVVGFSVHGGKWADKGEWSQNLTKAIQFAKDRGAKTIGFAGFDGGAMKRLCDACIVVPKDSTPHVEGLHVVLSHLIIFALKEKITED